jgi:hypothetical protein
MHNKSKTLETMKGKLVGIHFKNKIYKSKSVHMRQKLHLYKL